MKISAHLIDGLDHGDSLPAHLLDEGEEREVCGELAGAEEAPHEVDDADGAGPAAARAAVDQHRQRLASLHTILFSTSWVYYSKPKRSLVVRISE